MGDRRRGRIGQIRFLDLPLCRQQEFLDQFQGVLVAENKVHYILVRHTPHDTPRDTLHMLDEGLGGLEDLGDIFPLELVTAHVCLINNCRVKISYRM
jgi:hypothetical protein